MATATIQQIKASLIKYNSYIVDGNAQNQEIYHSIANDIWNKEIAPFAINTDITTWEADIKAKFITFFCRVKISEKQAYCLARALAAINPGTIPQVEQVEQVEELPTEEAKEAHVQVETMEELVELVRAELTAGRNVVKDDRNGRGYFTPIDLDLFDELFENCDLEYIEKNKGEVWYVYTDSDNQEIAIIF